MGPKIAIMIGGLSGGGAENQCVIVANELAYLNYSVDLVVLGLNNAVWQRSLTGKVNLINLKVTHAHRSLFSIYRYLRKNKPEVVLSFNVQISVVLSLIRLFFKCKFKLASQSVTILSIDEREKKGIWHGFVSRLMIKKILVLSDIIIAQSSAGSNDLVEYLSLDRNKIVVINNPLNKRIEEYAKLRSLIDVPKENYLLCVGRLEKEKAFHYALDAFACLVPEYPLLRLKFVGQGSLEARLRIRANDLKVFDRVDFEGFQAEMIPYYLKAEATVLTSLYEGFPNCLVESIALGTPVVAFDCPGGVREIVEQEVNGFLVEHIALEQLVECLRKALSYKWNIDAIRMSAEKYYTASIIPKYVKVLI